MITRAKAPLRISFAGGGTDVPDYFVQEGGCVLNAAINQFAYASFERQAATSIETNGDLEFPRAVIGKLGLSGRVFLQGDVPPGSGLGSSSALVVALAAIAFPTFSPSELAEEAHRIERKELKLVGGMQDQYAAAYGGFSFIEFSKKGIVVHQLRIDPYILNELEHNLLLIYTGQVRRSEHIVEDQIARYKAGHIEALRQQKEIAYHMKVALLTNKLDYFGQLLGKAWHIKKEMSPKVTTQFIDELYRAAMQEGALGGKITGAGAGGHMLFYCPFEKKRKIAAVLESLGASVVRFSFEKSGARSWKIYDNKESYDHYRAYALSSVQ